MLDIGSFGSRCCNGMNRRTFVRAASSLPFVAGLPKALSAAANARHGRAKSVMMVWLWGGPSHIDTFDPKPHAPSGIRGPFKTIATRTTGAHFTELLPLICLQPTAKKALHD
jgi:uncharacterized protein (DUF1501 family)